jgi:hypothetical protein
VVRPEILLLRRAAAKAAELNGNLVFMDGVSKAVRLVESVTEGEVLLKVGATIALSGVRLSDFRLVLNITHETITKL